ncbi:MAG: transposase [Candidatus Palauibacterales bacterium]|nr:transposase [Candidatus Palauibacterales bacterium]MDP2530677.1 transposase [Candidatus Palauibacterales bacterium]
MPKRGGEGGAGGRGGRGGRRTPAAHRLYAQLAWPTLGGLPLLGDRHARALERELIALCVQLDVEPVEVRVSADRVQLLVRFGPTQALTDVARRLKRASLVALRRWRCPARWGRGFAASTVGPAQVHRLVRRLRAEQPPSRDDGASDTAASGGRPPPGGGGARTRPRRRSPGSAAGG